MNGFCVTSLKVKGVKVFQKLSTRLCLGLRVCMSVDWALVFPSLLLEGSSSTNMNGFCVTSLKVRGVKVRLDNITLFTDRLSAFSCKTNWGSQLRTSDSLNEGLPIKMTREKFKKKWYFFYEKDSRFNPRLIHKSRFLIGQVPIEKYGLKTLFLLFNI